MNLQVFLVPDPGLFSNMPNHLPSPTSCTLSSSHWTMSNKDTYLARQEEQCTLRSQTQLSSFSCPGTALDSWLVTQTQREVFHILSSRLGMGRVYESEHPEWFSISYKKLPKFSNIYIWRENVPKKLKLGAHWQGSILLYHHVHTGFLQCQWSKRQLNGKKCPLSSILRAAPKCSL